MCVCVSLCLQGQYRKALSSLHQMAAVQQPQPGQQSPSGQASLEHHRALIQQASCHYALGEYRVHTHSHTQPCIHKHSYIRLVGIRRHAYIKPVHHILLYMEQVLLSIYIPEICELYSIIH